MFNLIIGPAFVIFGVYLLVTPIDKLRRVFPKIGSPKVTKTCSVVVIICGALVTAAQIVSP